MENQITKESNIHKVYINLASQIVIAQRKQAQAQKLRDEKLSSSSQAVYQIEKYIADTLTSAKQINKTTFLLPNMSLTIKLKEGVRLIDWVEKYMLQKYKGHFDAVLINKSLWGI